MTVTNASSRINRALDNFFGDIDSAASALKKKDTRSAATRGNGAMSVYSSGYTQGSRSGSPSGASSSANDWRNPNYQSSFSTRGVTGGGGGRGGSGGGKGIWDMSKIGRGIGSESSGMQTGAMRIAGANVGAGEGFGHKVAPADPRQSLENEYQALMARRNMMEKLLGKRPEAPTLTDAPEYKETDGLDRLIGSIAQDAMSPTLRTGREMVNLARYGNTEGPVDLGRAISGYGDLVSSAHSGAMRTAAADPRVSEKLYANRTNYETDMREWLADNELAIMNWENLLGEWLNAGGVYSPGVA